MDQDQTRTGMEEQNQDQTRTGMEEQNQDQTGTGMEEQNQDQTGTGMEEQIQDQNPSTGTRAGSGTAAGLQEQVELKECSVVMNPLGFGKQLLDELGDGVSACSSSVCSPLPEGRKETRADRQRPAASKRKTAKMKEQDGTNGVKGHSCQLCGKTFKSSNSLKVHQIVHSEERPYSCGECGANFKLRNTLKLHKRIHTGEKPYSCGDCGAAFIMKSALISHRRVHTGERPYKCDECGKEVSTSGALTVHKRSHTGEKPYICDQCGKVFSTPGGLKFHMNLHTGEKPYWCESCGKKYACPGSLKTHQRVHSEKKCDQCGEVFRSGRDLANHGNIHRWRDRLPVHTTVNEYGTQRLMSSHHQRFNAGRSLDRRGQRGHPILN